MTNFLQKLDLFRLFSNNSSISLPTVPISCVIIRYILAMTELTDFIRVIRLEIIKINEQKSRIILTC